MVQISGPLKVATTNPAAVTQIWLRAPEARLQGSDYVTDLPDVINVENGQVAFTAYPGPLMMSLITPSQGVVKSVKLLVPDKSQATLAECIRAAGLASGGTLTALEGLAQEVAAELGRVPDLVAGALASDATIAAAARDAIDTAVAGRAPIQWAYHGTGTPALSNFPDARVGDVIERLSDGSKWRVDE